jgi:S-adenosylmethionine:tRNA ribosyltransferase-isomerase
MPLPPYIRREPDAGDATRYQSVFARKHGAVAAPHREPCTSTPSCSRRLEARGVHRAFVTLHVGAGTFQPVRTESVGAHVMHAEFVEVGAVAVAAVAAARARGARVIAIGTTVVRALESAAGGGGLAPYVGDSSLFIVPGFRFRVVGRDADQLPPAGVDAADAGQRLRGAASRCWRLIVMPWTAVPLFQLW